MVPKAVETEDAAAKAAEEVGVVEVEGQDMLPQSDPEAEASGGSYIHNPSCPSVYIAPARDPDRVPSPVQDLGVDLARDHNRSLEAGTLFLLWRWLRLLRLPLSTGFVQAIGRGRGRLLWHRIAQCSENRHSHSLSSGQDPCYPGNACPVDRVYSFCSRDRWNDLHGTGSRSCSHGHVDSLGHGHDHDPGLFHDFSRDCSDLGVFLDLFL